MQNRENQLRQFNNEVIVHGPLAVLPQHLNEKWLRIVEKQASEYLDATYTLEECHPPQPVAGAVLMACVGELLAYQQVDPTALSDREIGEKLTAYALYALIESVGRESDIGIEKPSMDSIFSAAQIDGIRLNYPEFNKTLRQACILRYPEKNFFEKALEKLRSAVRK